MFTIKHKNIIAPVLLGVNVILLIVLYSSCTNLNESQDKMSEQRTENHECRFWAIIKRTDNSVSPITIFKHLLTGDSQTIKTLGQANDDGWGIGYYINDDSLEPVVLRGFPPAANDSQYDAAITQTANAGPRIGVVHVRQTSSGITPPEGNPHPFKRNKNGQWWLFGHNGTIDKTVLKQLIGDTYLAANAPQVGANESEWIDSELYFIFILKKYEENGWKIDEAIVDAIIDLTLNGYTDGQMNFFLTNGDSLWTFSSKATEGTGSYTLCYQVDSEYYSVASEYLNNEISNWIPMSPFTLAKIQPGNEPVLKNDIKYSFTCLVDSDSDGIYDDHNQPVGTDQDISFKIKYLKGRGTDLTSGSIRTTFPLQSFYQTSSFSPTAYSTNNEADWVDGSPSITLSGITNLRWDLISPCNQAEITFSVKPDAVLDNLLSITTTAILTGDNVQASSSVTVNVVPDMQSDSSGEPIRKEKTRRKCGCIGLEPLIIIFILRLCKRYNSAGKNR